MCISGITSTKDNYDGAGNRLRAIRNGTITKYIYDASGNLLAEADQNNVITRYYIYGLGLLAMVTPTDDVYCYHFDAIGSTIAITDDAESAVNKYAYTSFGKIMDETEAIPQPFKFVGQHGVMTEPNGLYYMRARYYDPQVGRFVSEDPAGFGGGDINLYVYVQNNPILYVDPNGEFAHIVGGVIGGGLIGGVSGGIVGFTSTWITSGGDFQSALKGALTGAVSGAAVGAVVGGFTAAGLPQLGLSASKLAGATIFGEGFVAGALSGEVAAVSSTAGTIAGAVGSALGPPVTPAYGDQKGRLGGGQSGK